MLHFVLGFAGECRKNRSSRFSRILCGRMRASAGNPARILWIGYHLHQDRAISLPDYLG